jgi:hypothetical protein
LPGLNFGGQVRSSTWIVGEYKNCETFATKPDQDAVLALQCDDTTETHALQVKFWGVNDTKSNRVWNCERVEDFFTKEDSLTCKLR